MFPRPQMAAVARCVEEGHVPVWTRDEFEVRVYRSRSMPFSALRCALSPAFCLRCFLRCAAYMNRGKCVMKISIL